MTSDELNWMTFAECLEQDPEIFFETRKKAVQETAREICKTCPVKQECNTYAWSLDRVVFEETGYRLHGMWATSTRHERVGLISNDEAVERRGSSRNQGARRKRPPPRF